MTPEKGDRPKTSPGISTELNRAHDSFSTGDFASARKYVAEVLASPDIDATSYVFGHLILLQIREREGSFDGLLSELEDLFYSDPLMEPSVQARIGNQIMRVCHRSENLEVGTQRGEEYLRVFHDCWPESEVVELQCQLAACHFFRGDSERGLAIAQKALDLAQKSKAPKPIAQSYWQLAAFSAHLGELARSLLYNREARYWAGLAEMNRLLPILNSNEAAMLLELPSQDLATIQQLAESAYLELTAYSDPGAATYACVTLSEVELRQSNFVRAHLYVEKGLSELPSEIPGPRMSLLVQRARVLARSGEYVESEHSVNAAIRIMNTMPASTTLANAWALVARVFVEIGLAERGALAYERSLQMSGLAREEYDPPTPGI